jgi:prepilin-type N-terminal cleavage/methylation domain-containing protein
MTTSSRRGFTLVELLIVIAIIGLLMGLLLPAVQSARERSRMATCNNNQRSIAQAMQSYVTTGKGAYPGWAQYVKLQGGQEGAVPWTAKLLGQLDQAALRDQMLAGDSTVMSWDAPPVLAVFNCPSDANTNPNVGALSFAVNTGWYDDVTNPLPGAYSNGSDVKANGICHDLRDGRRGATVKFGTNDIKDGAGATLLLSENVHTDDQSDVVGKPCTWMGPLQRLSYGAANVIDASKADLDTNPEQRFGITWVYDSNNPYTPRINLFQPINRDFDPDDPNVNKAYAELGGRFARPASVHPEVFIAAFCEGNTREISENIDYRVYQQLMTPDGQKIEDPADPGVMIEKVLRASNKGFMTPPLSQEDY